MGIKIKNVRVGSNSSVHSLKVEHQQRNSPWPTQLLWGKSFKGRKRKHLELQRSASWFGIDRCTPSSVFILNAVYF